MEKSLPSVQTKKQPRRIGLTTLVSKPLKRRSDCEDVAPDQPNKKVCSTNESTVENFNRATNELTHPPECSFLTAVKETANTEPAVVHLPSPDKTNDVSDVEELHLELAPSDEETSKMCNETELPAMKKPRRVSYITLE